MSHIGVDVGFTGTKAVIFSINGEILASSYNDYGARYKKDLLEKNEINPHFILDGVKKVLSACNSKYLKDKPKTIAVSVSGDDLFPIDAKGRPLHNALSAYNHKPVKYRKIILKKLGGPEKVFYETGQVVETDVLGLPRILWLFDNIPGLRSKTWKFLCWESYVNWYLTGIAVTDYSNASRFVTFDINKNCWSSRILEIFGLDTDKMPIALLAGENIGKIRNEVADELSLPHDLQVLAGGFDQATAALGAGVFKEGRFSLGMGTVFASHWVVNDFKKTFKDRQEAYDKPTNESANTIVEVKKETQQAINDVFNKIYPYCSYLVKDKYMGLLCNFNGSNTMNWFIDNLALNEKSRYKNKIYDYFNDKIDAFPSKLFFMPHFTGATYPVNDLNSRGTCIGLELPTDNKEILKAIYEGLIFELKLNYSNLIKTSGFDIKEIIAIGGSSRSKIWLQMMANILNLKVSTVKIDEGGCLACAMLGAVSTGEYKDIDEAITNLVKLKETYEPQVKINKLFEDKFAVYNSIYKSVKKFNKYLSRYR
jgi:xylulokinase